MTWNTHIPKFRRFVLQNFPFIEEDFDALTDYELICKVIEYLNKVITSQNEVVTEVERFETDLTNNFNSLEGLFNNLKSFVDNYFDNLDVQEEINNKLEQMAEDGSLQEIITAYIQSKVAWVFNTVEEMSNATNLVDGSYARTLGKYSKGDGYGALYEINSTTSDISIPNNLYAHVINDFGGNNYYNISFETRRINDTTCYITQIPLLDENQEQIPFAVKPAQKTISDYAQETKSSITINGPAFCDATHQYGTIISDGEVLADVNMADVPDCYYYIGIKSDRTMKDYMANQYREQDLLADGCEQVFLAYWRLISNNVIQDFETIDSELYDSNVVLRPNPRQCIGQKADKTIVILTCDGRTTLDKGLTSSEAAAIMQDLGCVNAWNLDGGGSTTTVIKGYKINKSVDNDGLDERVHKYLLTTNKEIIDNELGDSISTAGKDSNNIYNKLLPIVQQSIMKQTNGRDLDTSIQNQSLLLSNGTINPILSNITAYYVDNNCHPNPEYKGTYGRQMVSMRDSDRFFHRTLANGNFSVWHPYMGLYYTVFQNVINTYTTVDDTYEPVKFRGQYANITQYLTPGTKDSSGDFTEFTIECDDTDRFEFSYNITCMPASASRKYVRIDLDDQSIVTSITQNQVDDTFGYVTFSGSGFIDSSLKNKTIKLKVYGKVGDQWLRGRLSLKQVG